jgi:hypothetical protein
MDVTIGYGSSIVPRDQLRPVFVVQGSESAAAVEEEGWDALENAFFAGGIVLDENVALVPPARPRGWWWRERAVAARAALGTVFGAVGFARFARARLVRGLTAALAALVRR